MLYRKNKSFLVRLDSQDLGDLKKLYAAYLAECRSKGYWVNSQAYSFNSWVVRRLLGRESS